MVSAFITNVILHHCWAAPHNPPTHVNTRHRRRSGWHKWKVLHREWFDDILLCSLKARLPQMKTTTGALLYLQIRDLFFFFSAVRIYSSIQQLFCKSLNLRVIDLCSPDRYQPYVSSLTSAQNTQSLFFTLDWDVLFNQKHIQLYICISYIV